MPFEQIQIGMWLIEVDREATQAAYLNDHLISSCGCDYCQPGKGAHTNMQTVAQRALYLAVRPSGEVPLRDTYAPADVASSGVCSPSTRLRRCPISR